MMQRMDLDDAQLLGAPDPNGERFAAFYRRYAAEILRFVARRVRHPEIAADLTAEVFAAALQARRTFDPERGEARAWLCTIAANKIIDSHRRGQVDDLCRRRLGMSPVALEDTDLRRIEEMLSASSDIGSHARLLAELPADTRAAVRARVIDEREYVDIAEDLRCSESVVRKRVSRGLAALRLRLGENR